MLAHGYPFDAVSVPLNPFDASYRSFQKQVVPELIKQGIAVIGTKSLCGDASAVYQGAITAQEALLFAMSQPVATTVSGIDTLAILRQNLAIAQLCAHVTAGDGHAHRAMRPDGGGRASGAL